MVLIMLAGLFSFVVIGFLLKWSTLLHTIQDNGRKKK
jgi:hypothetical protein